jgi:hypothetical protein
MKVILDRFEGDYAIVELPDRTMVNMPKILLPKEAKEGDVVEIRILTEETKEINEQVNKLAKDLWKSI